MNSALKPILAQAGVPQPSGQASPAKANVAGVNHAGHPQGAQGSLLAPQAAPPAAAVAAAAPAPAVAAAAPAAALAPLVGQNLVQPGGGAAPPAPHAAPHMAPVSADMAQMAQNMSHHGNLSHVSQNSITPANIAASPSKSASSSAPLSLVADKPAPAPAPAPAAAPPAPSQPLALTRTPDKKEPESINQANGTVESAKPAASVPSPVKPLSNDIGKEKEPPKNLSPAKPAERAANPPSTPQKTEAANAVGQADGPAQAKVATASEPPEKSPAKPSEPKPAPTAEVAPALNDSKPEPANNKADKSPEKAAMPPAPKPEAASTEKAKAVSPAKPEPKKVENKPEKPATAAAEVKKNEPKPADTTDGPKKETKVEAEKPAEQKPETKKPETTPKATKAEVKAKSTLKLATVNTPIRKRRQASPTKTTEGPSPAKKVAESEGTPDSRTKRNRTQVQLYQSPTPELAMATKLSAVAAGRATPPKQNDDKLIVFYKNEYLAVRNAEGSFYVCQALQNVYRSTRKIKIRWLSQDKADSKGETYKPDFYDVTDMECVLTTLSLSKAPGGGGAQLLKPAEEARAKSILQRALAADTGDAPRELTEEHPDGLDLSLYKDESQLEKKSKRKATKTSPRKSDAGESPATPAAASKRPSRSPRKPSPARKPAGSKPPGAASKTAVTPKASKTPAKRTAKQAKLTPAKSEPPAKTPAKGRRATRESKPSPIVPTPSTSTGKATRTPRKPPAHK